MPYVASKPRCDVLDNLRTLFLYTQEGHLLTFCYYCTIFPGNTEEHWWDSSTINNISTLQSSVSDHLRSQDCKHCYFEDEAQLRAGGTTESSWLTVASRVTTHQLIPNNHLYECSWTTLQFWVFYFQNRLRMHMIRFSSSADRTHLLSHRSSSTL